MPTPYHHEFWAGPNGVAIGGTVATVTWHGRKDGMGERSGDPMRGAKGDHCKKHHKSHPHATYVTGGAWANENGAGFGGSAAALWRRFGMP